jgi:hypothetical protein
MKRRNESSTSSRSVWIEEVELIPKVEEEMIKLLEFKDLRVDLKMHNRKNFKNDYGG